MKPALTPVFFKKTLQKIHLRIGVFQKFLEKKIKKHSSF
jgi:hypothetical protein